MSVSSAEGSPAARAKTFKAGQHRVQVRLGTSQDHCDFPFAGTGDLGIHLCTVFRQGNDDLAAVVWAGRARDEAAGDHPVGETAEASDWFAPTCWASSPIRSGPKLDSTTRTRNWGNVTVSITGARERAMTPSRAREAVKVLVRAASSGDPYAGSPHGRTAVVVIFILVIVHMLHHLMYGTTSCIGDFP